MIFNRTILHELLSTIESINHTSWYNAIVDNCDYTQPSAFSEYEMYGNWVLKHHKHKIVIRSLRWEDVTSLPLCNEDNLDFAAMHWFSSHAHMGGYPT
jgi:tRNA G37 N-methylase TrmD